MLVSSSYDCFLLRAGNQVFANDTLPLKMSIWWADTPSMSAGLCFCWVFMPPQRGSGLQGWQMTPWCHPSPSVLISFLQFQQTHSRKGCSFISQKAHLYYLLVKIRKVLSLPSLPLQSFPFQFLPSYPNFLEEVNSSNWNLNGKLIDHNLTE